MSLDPVFKSVLNQNNSELDLISFGKNWFDEWAGFHHEKGIQIIIKNLLRFVNVLKDEGGCFGIGFALNL